MLFLLKSQGQAGRKTKKTDPSCAFAQTVGRSGHAPCGESTSVSDMTTCIIPSLSGPCQQWYNRRETRRRVAYDLLLCLPAPVRRRLRSPRREGAAKPAPAMRQRTWRPCRRAFVQRRVLCDAGLYSFSSEMPQSTRSCFSIAASPQRGVASGHRGQARLSSGADAGKSADHEIWI